MSSIVAIPTLATIIHSETLSKVCLLLLLLDISMCRDDSPVQPQMKTFPSTIMGGRKRCFQASWYALHQWLEYSVSCDSVFCFACRHFSPPNAANTVFDSVLGFKNWKKATEREGGFAVHLKSDRHNQAMMAWRDYQRAVKTNKTLENVLNEQHTKQVKENREYIKTIGEVLLLTARQNIAQRGHAESGDSNNKGNFKEILDIVANHDAVVKHRLTSIHNAKYTSCTIQNEVLECMADMIRSEIIEEVKQSETFSVMADETKDVSKNEQISFILRYYYNGVIKESFLHFEAAEKLDAAGLTEKIVQLLERHGLDYKNHLIGQAYDGAAVMSGKHSGVQARIKEKAKYAFYIHCSAHCLNLVLVDVVKTVPEAAEFFALLQSLYVFTSSSYVHAKWLAVQKDMYGNTRELQSLSDTRWACRFVALRNIMDRLPAIKQVLQELTQERRGEQSSEARGLLAQLDLEFVVHLVTFRKLFGETKILSDMLQAPDLDLSTAVDLVETLVQTLKDFREDTYFEKLWQEVLNISKQCDAATQNAKRQRKISSRLSDCHILSTVGQRELDSDKETFRTSFFYPVIDSMLAELSKRFSNTNCELMRSLRSLNPKSPDFLRDTTLFDFGRLYGANIDDLGHELHQFKRLLERKVQRGEIDKLSDTVQLARFIEPYKEVFFELFRLCKISLALPVSSASCERSFSTLKLVKNYLRSTMCGDRLSNLGVLSIESARSKALDLNAFVDRFARCHNRRILLL